MWKQNGVWLNWSDWIQFYLATHLTKVFVHQKKTVPTQIIHHRNLQTSQGYVQRIELTEQLDAQGMPAKTCSTQKNPNLLH